MRRLYPQLLHFCIQMFQCHVIIVIDYFWHDNQKTLCMAPMTSRTTRSFFDSMDFVSYFWRDNCPFISGMVNKKTVVMTLMTNRTTISSLRTHLSKPIVWIVYRSIVHIYNSFIDRQTSSTAFGTICGMIGPFFIHTPLK